MIELEIPIPRNLWKSMNRTAKNHGHLASIRRGIHQVTLTHIQVARPRPEPIRERVNITWTVHYPKGVSYVHGDPVNAAPVTKACLDAIVHAQLLPGDGPKHVARETFQRGENLTTRDEPHRILVQITELPAA